MKRVFSLLFAVVIAFAALATPAAAAQKSVFKVYGLDIALGDCSLLNMDGNWLLIDFGTADDADNIIKKIKGYGVTKLDFYLSHLHYDHHGDYKKLCEAFQIGKVYLPDTETIATDYPSQAKIAKKIAKATVNGESDRIVYLKRGSTFKYGSTTATVLGPVGNHSFDGPVDENGGDEDTHDELSSYINNCSLTTKFVCGSFSYITCGDIEKSEEAALVAKYKNGELKSTLLKMPHHGLSTSSSESFVKAVSPSYAYALNGGYNTLINRSDGTGKIRRCYTPRKTVSNYGVPYMVGDEGKDFIFCYDGSFKAYRGSESSAALLNGWVKLQGGDGVNVKLDKYYIKNGKALTGLQKIDGKLYYFSGGGCATLGSYKNGVYNPLRNTPNGLCAFKEDCSMYTGIQKIGNYNCYYSPQNGARVLGSKGWKLTAINGSTYALNESGVIYDKNCNYSGWLKFGSKLRYFDQNGKMQTGWKTINGAKYYLDKATGYRTTGLKVINGKTYYFSDSGKMYKGGWKPFGKSYRYFDTKTGIMLAGWQTIGGNKYYFDKSTGYRTTGLKKIGKNKYYFSDSGKMYKGGWKAFGKKYRYFNKKTGVMQTGWKTIGGSKYYFNKSTGYRTTGLKKIGKNKYYFSSSGKLYKKGWKTFGKKQRYFDKKTGVMLTGTKKIGGKKYKFDKSGYLKK